MFIRAIRPSGCYNRQRSFPCNRLCTLTSSFSRRTSPHPFRTSSVGDTLSSRHPGKLCIKPLPPSTVPRTNFSTATATMATPNRKKTVAVIGGGPSGLSAAKSLLEAGFAPTIFEARSHVGGLWTPLCSGVETTQLPADLKTNVSPFTCSFSDWWPHEAAAEGRVKMQLGVREVGDYLQGFRERYIPEEAVRCGCRVVSVSEEEQQGRWKVGWKDGGGGGENKEEVFDFLVVATGTFSDPFVPFVEELGRFEGLKLHCSKYDGEEVLPLTECGKRRILVVGGCLSGAEVPADLALRKASLKESVREGVEILHLFTQPPWILPKLLPFQNEADPMAPRVLPLDQIFYTAREMPEPAGPEEKFRTLHTGLKAMMGTDQADLGPEYTIDDYWSTKYPAIGMTESYDKFVRMGYIKPVLGRFAGITEDGAVKVSAVAGGKSEDCILTDIDTIVFATGYTPWPSLQRIFSPQMLAKMGIEPGTHNPAPGLLHPQLHKQVFHYELGKTIGFIGIQPRPFWVGVELQGRWLAGLFAGTVPWPDEQEVLDHRKGPEHLLSLGKVYDANLVVAQGGYLEILGDMSKALGIDPFKATRAAAHTPKPFIPAHLPPFGTAPNEYAAAAVNMLRLSVEKASYAPENIAKAVFAELQGTWNLTRTLVSKLPGFPDGTFHGTAVFHPRIPTFTPLVESPGRLFSLSPPPEKPPRLGRDVQEYLYTESGELTTSTGLKLQGTRRYVYSQCPETSAITVWFVKADFGSEGKVDYFFHCVDFTREVENLGFPGVEGEGGWKAAAEHLCDKDWYWPAYRFVFKAARLERFWIRYKVKGPQKDYVAETEYVRP
ncbi:hypothetical protein FN846DRAFT_972140 [Sphaerosporella brunnea]|uniref:DUF6314 domain-containing protein n=1 Tax=Sphaerosporella brunnea TaxID=1250544 RepID=A0A5J5EGT2_9PEZI|nr:hypothetical protein FN846DRAFT_972140 [Sphaerosporella brunnea]